MQLTEVTLMAPLVGGWLLENGSVSIAACRKEDIFVSTTTTLAEALGVRWGLQI